MDIREKVADIFEDTCATWYGDSVDCADKVIELVREHYNLLSKTQWMQLGAEGEREKVINEAIERIDSLPEKTEYIYRRSVINALEGMKRK